MDQSYWRRSGERKDRQGNGAIRFARVSFQSETASECSWVISGKPLTIVLEFEGLATLPIRSLDLHITFFSSNGQLMFTCSSLGVGYRFDLLDAKGCLVCQIAKLPLSAGTYSYNLYSSVQGQASDWIKEAGFLTVIESDFYGSEKVVWNREGILVEQTWDIPK